jgi:thiol-disulfide isomerase/thioredoxin
MDKRLLVSLFFLILLLSPVYAQPYKVTVHFFWGQGCPHCAAEKEFLGYLEEKYPVLDVSYYEVYYNRTNSALLVNLSEVCGFDLKGVPMTFIGERVIEGYRDEATTGREIEEEIQRCIESETGCIDPLTKLENETAGTCACPSGGTCACPAGVCECPQCEGEDLSVNFFGMNIDPEGTPLIAFTIVIGLLDGFNPCEIFLFMFLIALMITAHSRKRMLIIGGVFIFVAGTVYYFFMVAWLNLFLFIGYLPLIQMLAGLVAVTVGVINIKDFFFFEKGPSLIVPKSVKPRLIKKMRQIVKESSLPAMILGVALLAVSVNFFELLCSFGLPMVYTRVLTMHNLDPVSYYVYMMVYIMMYLLPEIFIFFIAFFTMSAYKFTEKEGRVLKLIGGLLMLLLGLALIFKPELLVF